jgi:hypothetical protein
MSNKSDALVYGIVKQNHSKLIKRRTNGRIQLSTEAFNLSGRNTYASSGYRSQALDLQIDADKVVTIRKKDQDNTGKIAKSVKTIALKKKSTFTNKTKRVLEQAHGFRGDIALPLAQRFVSLRKASPYTQSKQTTDVIKTA